MGKTAIQRCEPDADRKHPHGRGEDVTNGALYNDDEETPPRAWGRPNNVVAAPIQAGNTPTGVGKTNSLQNAQN
ncbi:hypothetical protein BMETH_296_2 [methanotrophic bacterial endosymbiont of Bathymodiolus sp.]|nr:hypothetical protein BMETH_296_2 [methanotrophic bacterial endosymbiont of Bathymodiolus sp.]